MNKGRILQKIRIILLNNPEMANCKIGRKRVLVANWNFYKCSNFFRIDRRTFMGEIIGDIFLNFNFMNPSNLSRARLRGNDASKIRFLPWMALNSQSNFMVTRDHFPFFLYYLTLSLKFFYFRTLWELRGWSTLKNLISDILNWILWGECR